MSFKQYREAMKEPANLAGIATSVALSAALLNPLPLLAGFVLEAAYLTLVPDSKWYKSILSKREQAEAERLRQEFKAKVLPTLRPEMQQRFVRLEATRTQIAAQSGKEQRWFSETPRKLDYLLDKFLVFASKEAEFLQYLQSVRDEVCGKDREVRGRATPSDQRTRKQQEGTEPPVKREMRADQYQLDLTQRWGQQTVELVLASYTREKGELQQVLENEQDKSTQAVLQKRAEILKRRAEFLDKMGKMLLNLAHQLQLLEDTFGLINDQIRARSPEQILADIDDVVSQTDSMTRILEELAPYEHMVTDIDRTGVGL